MRDLLADMLGTLGYQVELKTNCLTGVDAVWERMGAREEYAGIMMELTIPGGMGGLDATRKLRDFHCPIPI